MILMKNIMNINIIKITIIIIQMKINQIKNDIIKDTKTIIQTLDTIINVVYLIQKYKEIDQDVVYMYSPVKNITELIINDEKYEMTFN